jgi:indolepyruvate decarboxylase
VMDDASDCIVALGTIVTDDYLNIMYSSFGEMIEITDEEARVGYEYYHRVTLQDFLAGLLDRFREDERSPRTYDLPNAETPSVPAAEEGDGLSYNIFYAELSTFLKNEELLGETALVLGESTSLYVFGNLFGLPRGSFVAQAAWGSLGHETGCALGVALGSGKRPWVVAGDGGFRMVCQELSSLAYRKCNAVVFVLGNDVYAIEQAFVDIDAFTPTGQFAPFDVLPPWDYVALAQAFGAKGYRVATVAELRAALAEVKDLEDVPALVEVVIPQKDLAPQLKRLAETPPDTRKYRP